MPITVITGLPGSGKTTRVIELVERARAAREHVLLFACADAVEFGPDSPLRRSGNIASRNGRAAKIDHFVGREEAKAILDTRTNDPRTRLIFDEAQYFGLDLVGSWVSLSRAGHEVVLSTPTPQQIRSLGDEISTTEALSTECALMGDGPATRFFVMPNGGLTLSVCDRCAETLLLRARKTIGEMLVRQEPHPGEARTYQPVDLKFPEFEALKPIREDCVVRAEIMASHVASTIGAFEPRRLTYADVGCNIGYFCKRMADLGFVSHGVDIVPGDIRVAKLLDRYFYQRYMEFVCEDAVRFIARDSSRYDVMSAFSVFQWVLLQAGKSAMDGALDKMFRQARRLVFLEMGYTDEKHYQGRLTERIDRAWCEKRMKDSGRFSDVVMYEQGHRGLKRDLFVGICNPN